MTITIRLNPQLYDHIRNLVRETAAEDVRRKTFEKLAVEVRGKLEALSGPKIGPRVRAAK